MKSKNRREAEVISISELTFSGWIFHRIFWNSSSDSSGVIVTVNQETQTSFSVTVPREHDKLLHIWWILLKSWWTALPDLKAKQNDPECLPFNLTLVHNKHRSSQKLHGMNRLSVVVMISASPSAGSFFDHVPEMEQFLTQACSCGTHTPAVKGSGLSSSSWGRTKICVLFHMMYSLRGK